MAPTYSQRPKNLTKILAILQEDCTTESSRATGRPEMSLRNILVFGILRLSLNIDHDRLMELANNHITIRQMPGHGGVFDSVHRYALQTIKFNFPGLTFLFNNKALHGVAINYFVIPACFKLEIAQTSIQVVFDTLDPCLKRTGVTETLSLFGETVKYSIPES